MYRHQLAQLDLHGEEAAFVYSLVNEFLRDSVKLKRECVAIIHGKSTNILTNEVHRVLKGSRYVDKYKLNNMNLGETIVLLKY